MIYSKENPLYITQECMDNLVAICKSGFSLTAKQSTQIINLLLDGEITRHSAKIVIKEMQENNLKFLNQFINEFHL